MRKTKMPALAVAEPSTAHLQLWPPSGWGRSGGCTNGHGVFVRYHVARLSNQRLRDLLFDHHRSSNALFRQSAGLLTQDPPPAFAHRFERLNIPSPSDHAIGVFLLPPRPARTRKSN